jgi:signal transduction histidine kinase
MRMQSMNMQNGGSGKSASYRVTPNHMPDAFANAGAAHDLGNYLQVISSAVRIIERSLSQEARLALDPVMQGAQASLEHAYRLSRQVAARPTVDCSSTTSVSIARRIALLDPVILLAVGPDIRVEYHVTDAPDVACDAQALDNAIMNLVINAARAMANGSRASIALTVDAGLLDDLPAAVLRIADTGCGMSSEAVESAFDAGTTTKVDRQGRGLGLATVRAFVNAAKGRVAIESRSGVGTVVTLCLPGVLKPAARRSGA